MQYNQIYKSTFQERLNRFVSHCLVDGKIEVVHVKNTGRCKELLISGAEVYLQKSDSQSRKTNYSLITVNKNHRLINIDSQIPNDVVFEALNNSHELEKMFDHPIQSIKREKSYGGSRFDFYIETSKDKIFVEVKGVTLEKDNVAMFPDAPTLRGVKHINELQDACRNGFKAYIIFVIQMEGVEYFTPNAITHKEFADALKTAANNGVEVIAYDCKVSESSICLNKRVPVKL